MARPKQEEVAEGEFTEAEVAQQEDEQILAFNGKGYRIADLSERSKSLILHLQDLTRQRQEVNTRLEQIDEASKGFTVKLEESVVETPSYELPKPE